MKDVDVWRYLLTISGGIASAFFGGFDVIFQVLCILIAVDFFTGYAKAIALSKLSSKKAFIGGVRKFLIFAVIICFAQIDRAITSGASDLFNASPNFPPIFRSSAIAYYILGESLSLLENVAAMGLPVPTGLVTRLDLFKNHADEIPAALKND